MFAAGMIQARRSGFQLKWSKDMQHHCTCLPRAPCHRPPSAATHMDALGGRFPARDEARFPCANFVTFAQGSAVLKGGPSGVLPLWSLLPQQIARFISLYVSFHLVFTVSLLSTVGTCYPFEYCFSWIYPVSSQCCELVAVPCRSVSLWMNCLSSLSLLYCFLFSSSDDVPSLFSL